MVPHPVSRGQFVVAASSPWIVVRLLSLALLHRLSTPHAQAIQSYRRIDSIPTCPACRFRDCGASNELQPWPPNNEGHSWPPALASLTTGGTVPYSVRSQANQSCLRISCFPSCPIGGFRTCNVSPTVLKAQTRPPNSGVLRNHPPCVRRCAFSA